MIHYISLPLALCMAYLMRKFVCKCDTSSLFAKAIHFTCSKGNLLYQESIYLPRCEDSTTIIRLFVAIVVLPLMVITTHICHTLLYAIC